MDASTATRTAGPRSPDALTRFVVEDAPVRGAVVQLADAHGEVLSRHPYPPRLASLLGELLAASALLASTLKFRGRLTAQLQSRGALRLLVVECSHALELRATAQWEGNIEPGADLAALIGEDRSAARLVITLDPADGRPMYQGIVEVTAGSIASLLEHYFATSEQLPSRLWLDAEGGEAAGLLLQRLPGDGDDEAWRRLVMLAGTVTAGELHGLAAERLLGRLFAEESIRVFRPVHPKFHCPCSVARVAGALRLLGRSEVESILEEQGEVSVTCEFCNRLYRFDREQALALLSADASIPENLTRH